MRILIILTYYQPYRSGVTIYAVRLAKALVERGHEVRVLTSQYEKQLPAKEILDGVEVMRIPVAGWLSKAAVMPGLYPAAWKWIRWAEVVNLHLPQMDGAPLALMSRWQGKPVIVTYQCDIHLPAGFINSIANWVSKLLNWICGKIARKLVALSQDYADHSSFFNHFPEKVVAVEVPVVLPDITNLDVDHFRQKYGIQPGDQIIGMVARLAAEKGVEYLVEALPVVLQRFPDAKVFYAGQYQKVLGEEAYLQKLAPTIETLGNHWKFLGPISEEEKAAFFRCCQLTVLPSVNSTEAFGIVQIESMISGTPVVASDLPGVRQPVLTLGMGKIFPARDAKSLAQAILGVLENREQFTMSAEEAARQYSPQTTAQKYEKLFEESSKYNR